MEWGPVWDIIIAVYVCKVSLAVLDTPLIYIACHATRRYLGLDDSVWTEEAPLA